jgi:hypothetical protein
MLNAADLASWTVGASKPITMTIPCMPLNERRSANYPIYTVCQPHPLKLEQRSEDGLMEMLRDRPRHGSDLHDEPRRGAERCVLKLVQHNALDPAQSS